ncbi:PaaI family thioesterase [uncultured Clostridium sp.]|uniref:PaaI family thioesterase n=1 Tax=uncultured Clostridium sp. TaxID=59620 RepID=UPI00260FB934|nr:PaaI family thioesterase [uncultured Clostridium sp.]
MERKVVKKQYSSKNCLICGVDNKLGLHTEFYELDNGDVVGVFKTLEEHQSYPGRVHGGIAGALLDETVGRVINLIEKDTWGVTIELQVKYRKPIPLCTELRVVGRITKNTHRMFEGEGEILLEDGTVAATGKARYMKIPVEKIASGEFSEDDWFIEEKESDPTSFDLPEVKK